MHTADRVIVVGVERDLDRLELGFWDAEHEEFVPMDEFSDAEVRRFIGRPRWREVLEYLLAGSYVLAGLAWLARWALAM